MYIKLYTLLKIVMYILYMYYMCIFELYTFIYIRLFFNIFLEYISKTSLTGQ